MQTDIMLYIEARWGIQEPIKRVVIGSINDLSPIHQAIA